MGSQPGLDFGQILAPTTKTPLDAVQCRADDVPGHGRYVIGCERCGRVRRVKYKQSLFCSDACRSASRHEEQGQKEERKKARGMKGSAGRNAEYLAIAREAAHRIRLRDGDCDADRVHLLLEDEGTILPSSGWWGSLFVGAEWESTGHTVKCRHEGSHGRRVMVWR